VGGLFNNIRNALGFDTVLAMQKESWFRPIYVISSIWKDAGWGTVVYLAAISGIDLSLYESAAMDGASRFSKIKYITFPLLIPTIFTLFLLNIGSFLELGFDHVFNTITPMTYSVGDIFDTYVYRVGIQKAQYSFTTAVGLFQSIIGLILVTTFNKLANKYSDEGGLW
jgi:putative aldouronate transport system permease protein